MFNFTKTGRSPGLLARLAAFGQLFTPERSSNPSLHRYARHYYLKYHRGNFGIKASDYVLQIVVAAVILYASSSCILENNGTTGQETLVISGVAIVVSILAIIHAMVEFGRCVSGAAKFADDAILEAETKVEVDEYFREIYPFTIYDS